MVSAIMTGIVRTSNVTGMIQTEIDSLIPACLKSNKHHWLAVLRDL